MKMYQAITIFPRLVEALTQFGITKKAFDKGLYNLKCWDLRIFSARPHGRVDDRPYGGGPGMVMQFEPLERAIDEAKRQEKISGLARSKVIHVTPQGRTLNNLILKELEKEDNLIFLAGRYEGIDERLIESRVDEEISVGDYVVSGGELPVMMIIDSLVRRIPGAVGNGQSVECESFENGLLDYPHYTRPEKLENKAVPSELLSGNHRIIERWRMREALGRTWQRRPDLFEKIISDISR